MHHCRFGADQEQSPPPSSHQPPHPHPRHHRGHKTLGKREAAALDMDTLSDASAAASLLTVLLEQHMSDAQRGQLAPVIG